MILHTIKSIPARVIRLFHILWYSLSYVNLTKHTTLTVKSRLDNTYVLACTCEKVFYSTPGYEETDVWQLAIKFAKAFFQMNDDND